MRIGGGDKIELHSGAVQSADRGACCDVTAAVGCEDPELPGDVTFRRDGNRGVLTCHDKSLVHKYIVCEDNRWIGDIPVCSEQLSDSNSHGNHNVGTVKNIRISAPTFRGEFSMV